jgi:hypothetical protein
MVQQQEITEDIPTASPKVPIPKETSFDDPDDYQYAPLPKSGFSIRGILEWSFEKMRPKSSIVQKPAIKRNPVKNQMEIPDNFYTQGILANDNRHFEIPEGYEVQNGLILQKKSLAEKVRDQLKHPQLKLAGQLIPGVALAAFAIGAIMVYSELPGRPSLVIGIILLCIAGNVIVSNYR